MRLQALAVSALLAVALSSPADDSVLRFLKFSKAIDSASTHSETAPLAIELDSDIYAATLPGLPDIRIIAGRTEIPFAIKRVEASSVKIKRQIECPSKLVSFVKTPDNCVELVLERLLDQPGSELAASTVSISTRAKNFEKRVRVQTGSSPDGPWRELADEAPIYDYSDFIDFSRTSLSFPETSSRFIKVTISNYTEDVQSPVESIVREFRGDANIANYRHTLRVAKSIRIDALTLFGSKEIETEIPELLKDCKLGPASVTQAGQNSIITVESKHEPLHSLIIATDSSYFMRRVMLECADSPSSEWRPLASGSIYSIGNGTSRDAKLSIDFPETRAGAYRIKISNGDAPAINVKEVAGRSAVYRAEFVAQPLPLKDLRLLYGAEAIRKPSYDTESVLAKMSHAKFVQLKLGPQEKNPLYSNSRPLISSDAKLPLYILAIAVAALMGFLILKGAKRIEASSENSSK